MNRPAGNPECPKCKGVGLCYGIQQGPSFSCVCTCVEVAPISFSKPTPDTAAELRDEVLDEAADFVDALAEKARGTRSADALAMAAAEIRKQLKTVKPNTGTEISGQAVGFIREPGINPPMQSMAAAPKDGTAIILAHKNEHTRVPSPVQAITLDNGVTWQDAVYNEWQIPASDALGWWAMPEQPEGENSNG